MVRGPVRGKYPPVLVAVRGQGGDRHAGWLCWYWPLLSPPLHSSWRPGLSRGPTLGSGWLEYPGGGAGRGGEHWYTVWGRLSGHTNTVTVTRPCSTVYSPSLLLSLSLLLFLSALHSLHLFYLKYKL